MKRYSDILALCIAIVITCIILISLIHFSKMEYETHQQQQEYCISQGWDKLKYNDYGDYFEFKCLRYEPHEAGLGYNTIESGYIPREVLKNDLE